MLFRPSITVTVSQSFIRSMKSQPPDKLAASIRQAFRDLRGRLWFPSLTEALASSAWSTLSNELELTKGTYSTTRVLRQSPEEPRTFFTSCDIKTPGGSKLIAVEVLPREICERYFDGEADFLSTEQLQHDVATRITAALTILGTVPTVLPTIASLIRTLHLLKTADDDIDISFSQPSLPFSVFVSIPPPSAAAGALRLAEALLHEAMHLQLTFIETFVPLVEPTGRSYYSPWRSEYRSAQGVLHALYVFRVIDSFLALVQLKGPHRTALRVHASERRDAIASQVREIYEFRDCPDLTAAGKEFVDRLLS